MQQVRGGVVGLDGAPARRVHARAHLLARLQRGEGAAAVQPITVFLARVLDLEHGYAAQLQRADVADLAAAFGVEGRGVEHQRARRAGGRGGDGDLADDASEDARRARVLLVAGEARSRDAGAAQARAQGFGEDFAGHVAAGAGALALLLHGGVEAASVVGEAVLLDHDLRDVGGKAVRVVQFEGDAPGEHAGAALPLERVQLRLQAGDAAREHLAEALFLGGGQRLDRGLLLAQFRVGRRHDGLQGGQELGQERAIHPELDAVAHGAAQNFAHHVAAALPAGSRAVRDAEEDRARVVGDAPHAHVGGGVGAIAAPAEALDAREQGREDVGAEVVGHVLGDGGDAFEAQADVDVLARQRLQHPAVATVELREHAVADLEEALRQRRQAGGRGQGLPRRLIPVDL